MPFAFSARTYVFVAILPALSLAAACTTMRLEDTVPATAAAAPPAQPSSVTGEQAPAVSYAPDEPAAALPTRPTTRGGFPNLNIRPATAGEQLTASERLQKSRELETARQRAAEEAPARPRAARTAAEIQRDARRREEETLRRIEGR